jgi:hypothetical protein
LNPLLKKSARLVWIGLLAWVCLLMIELTLPYVTFKKNVDFLLTKLNVYHISYWRMGFYIHIFSSLFTLTAGFTQFSGYIIRNYPKVHRFAGNVYIVVLLFISGPGAWAMAFHANGGLPARASFVLLTFLWYVFTLISVYYIRKKNWTEHGHFMLRSYALTFSAVTLRFYAYMIDVMHLDIRPVEAYITLAWLSWVPNLLIAETLIRSGFVKRLFRSKING